MFFENAKITRRKPAGFQQASQSSIHGPISTFPHLPPNRCFVLDKENADLLAAQQEIGSREKTMDRRSSWPLRAVEFYLRRSDSSSGFSSFTISGVCGFFRVDGIELSLLSVVPPGCSGC